MSGDVDDGGDTHDGGRAHQPETDDASRLTLGELTEAADVSVRTVRYYIAEGLLPPPAGAGPASVYTTGHLDRLRLIQRLKAAYLPLKEIRRRLAGLGDDEIRAVLASQESGRQGPERQSQTLWEPEMAEAREYLALLESRERYHTEPLALSVPTSGGASPAPGRPGGKPEPVPRQEPRARAIFPAGRPAAQETEAGQGQGLWHRIALGDEVELVISERVYARYRDRVDWLVRWARKVFG